MEQREEKIEGRRDFATGTGVVSDLLTSATMPSGHVIARHVALKDSNRLFHVSASASEAEYPRLADDFMLAVCQFKILNTEGKNYAEELSIGTVPDKKLRFQFPASWKYAPDAGRQNAIANDDQLVVTRLDDDIGVPARGATILVILSETTEAATEQRLLARFESELERLGISVGAPDVTVTPQPLPYLGGRLYRFEARRDDVDIYCVGLLLVRPDAVLWLGLAAPARHIAPLRWGVHKRAFEIVRDTVTIG